MSESCHIYKYTHIFAVVKGIYLKHIISSSVSLLALFPSASAHDSFVSLTPLIFYVHYINVNLISCCIILLFVLGCTDTLALSPNYSFVSLWRFSVSSCDVALQRRHQSPLTSNAPEAVRGTKTGSEQVRVPPDVHITRWHKSDFLPWCVINK